MHAPESLILDFLAWLDAAPRPYAEVMDAWRTSCPRLPVWEDAVDRGLVGRRRCPETGESLVEPSARGRMLLADGGRVRVPSMPLPGRRAAPEHQASMPA